MVDTAMHARMLNSLVALVLLLGATGAARASCDGAEQGLAAAQEELGQGRVDSALARLAALARSHPKCGETPLLQAQVHAALGNARQAEGFFSEAITLAPGQPAPIFQLGGNSTAGRPSSSAGCWHSLPPTRKPTTTLA